MMNEHDNSISINNNFCPNLGFAAAVMRFYQDWKNESECISAKTSGSTGIPKEISLAKKAMRISAQQTIDFFEIKPEQNLLLCLPVEFIAGKMMVVRSIVAKAHLVITETSTNPLVPLVNSKKIPIHFAAFTPFQVSTILANSETKEIFSSIKTTIIGGGEISAALEKQLRKINSRIFATYGMTETITHIAVRNIHDEQKIYKAFKGIHLGQDERNCLTITANYLGNQPIVTNDIVAFEGPREFQFIGRFDNVINSGGVKIHPTQVEAKLDEYIPEPYFIHFKTDDELGQKVILVIERKQPYDAITLGLLQSTFKDILNKFEIPKEVLFQAQFNRTETGKIIRNIQQ